MDETLDTEALVQRWQALKTSLDVKKIRLIAVSKYTSETAVKTLADAGQKDFGEARPQQLRDRAEKFPELHWHMIGPVQKNKAKYIGRHAAMWHSLSDEDTAHAVAKHVNDRILPVLIQVNISGEEQKSGVSPENLPALFQKVQEIDSLQVMGLMGM
ncbi:MAG: alanine racemase, partial [Mariprofundaceae bacterium]